jgi:hypothetical protein
MDLLRSIESLIKFGKTNKKELVILKGCHHYHQSDLICLLPVEAFVRTKLKPQTNVCELYLLNTQIVSQFLHKIGLSHISESELCTLNEHVESQLEFFEHKIKFMDKVTDEENGSEQASHESFMESADLSKYSSQESGMKYLPKCEDDLDLDLQSEKSQGGDTGFTDISFN